MHLSDLRCISFSVFLALASDATAAGPELAIPEMGPAMNRDSSGFSFELLPKSFQKNPQLEMTVISELTDLGRTLPLTTPEHPVYYFGVNSGFVARGEVVGGEHPPDSNYLGRLLERTLRANGFLAADKTHPPTQTLFFHWGSHAAMDQEMRATFPEKYHQQVLERAVLVGGRSFRKEMSDRINYGDNIAYHTSKIDFLTEQAATDLYYIIVSAYDFNALKRGDRQLLWRANLTVAAAGVSMTDSLPALVLTGGPFFGRDLKESEILFRRVQRGVVELGPTKVLEANVPVSSTK